MTGRAAVSRVQFVRGAKAVMTGPSGRQSLVSVPWCPVGQFSQMDVPPKFQRAPVNAFRDASSRVWLSRQWRRGLRLPRYSLSDQCTD